MTSAERETLKRQAEEVLNLRGGNVRPFPPRDVRAAGSATAVLVTFKLPETSDDVVSFNVYRNTESNLVATLKKSVRQYFVPATESEVVSVFVSSVNALGRESEKIQAIATANAHDDGVATPPPEFEDEAAAGGDTSGSGVGRNEDAVDREPRSRGTN